MPDNFVIPFLAVAAVGGWATACALLLISRIWERRCLFAERQERHLRGLLDQKTPHQRGAETRAARVSAERQRHIDRIMASIGR